MHLLNVFGNASAKCVGQGYDLVLHFAHISEFENVKHTLALQCQLLEFTLLLGDLGPFPRCISLLFFFCFFLHSLGVSRSSSYPMNNNNSLWV
jgi:hypothetical protein